MKTELESEDYRQLAAVYQLLSHLWLREIDLGLLTALASEAMRPAFENLGGVLPAKIDAATVDALAVDYCQILIGPQGCVSPVQSVWEHQLMEAEPARSMRKYFDLLPDYQPPENIPDHFGVQLHFMSQLFERAAQPAHAELCQQVADEFFRKHLSWTGPFLAKVKSQAETDFYAGLADLTANFLNLEPSDY